MQIRGFIAEYHRFWRGVPEDYVLKYKFFSSDFLKNEIVNHGISCSQMNLI